MALRTAILELPVADVPLAIGFYELRLRFRHQVVRSDSAVVARDGVEIRLWSARRLENHLAATERDLDGGYPKVAGSASGRIRVTGLRQLYEHCQHSGVVHPNGPLSRVESWHLDEFVALDLDRNALLFFEPVRDDEADRADGVSLLSSIPTLPVSDVHQTVRFYQDELGFTTIAARPGYGRVRRDDVELHFWHAGGVSRGAETYLAGTGRCRVTVSDLDRIATEYHEHRVLARPDEVAVRDPDGNLLTFVSSQ